ncbi:hypothetical protein Chor_012432 [Crotalus horridus]
MSFKSNHTGNQVLPLYNDKSEMEGGCIYSEHHDALQHAVVLILIILPDVQLWNRISIIFDLYLDLRTASFSILSHSSRHVSAMWLFLPVLVAVLFLLHRWYLERQMVENLTEKYVFITGCDSGFGNQLARQLDAQGLRVLASCLTPEAAEQLEKVTSDRLKTTLLDVTNAENVAAATENREEKSRANDYQL